MNKDFADFIRWAKSCGCDFRSNSAGTAYLYREGEMGQPPTTQTFSQKEREGGLKEGRFLAVCLTFGLNPKRFDEWVAANPAPPSVAQPQHAIEAV